MGGQRDSLGCKFHALFLMKDLEEIKDIHQLFHQGVYVTTKSWEEWKKREILRKGSQPSGLPASAHLKLLTQYSTSVQPSMVMHWNTVNMAKAKLSKLVMPCLGPSHPGLHTVPFWHCRPWPVSRAQGEGSSSAGTSWMTRGKEKAAEGMERDGQRKEREVREKTGRIRLMG